MKRIDCLLAAASLVAAVANASAMIPEQVRIETGLIAGTVSTSQPGVVAFKGIPFAAPPLGENRWRAPQPAAKWEGVRNRGSYPSQGARPRFDVGFSDTQIAGGRAKGEGLQHIRASSESADSFSTAEVRVRLIMGLRVGRPEKTGGASCRA